MKLTKEDLIKIIKEELEDRWIPKAKPLTTSSGEVYAYEPPEEWLGVESPSRQMSVLDPAIDLSAVEDPGEPMVSQDIGALLRTHFPGDTLDPRIPAHAEIPETKAQELDQILADEAERQRMLSVNWKPVINPMGNPDVEIKHGPTVARTVPTDPSRSLIDERITKQDLVEMIKKHMEGLFEKKTKATAPGQKRVSKKIGHLVGKEGKSQEQAAAIAYSMEDRGELKKGGKHSV